MKERCLLMEMLPGAVQVLIAWLEFIYATILTYFRKKNADEE